MHIEQNKRKQVYNKKQCGWGVVMPHINSIQQRYITKYYGIVSVPNKSHLNTKVIMIFIIIIKSGHA